MQAKILSCTLYLPTMVIQSHEENLSIEYIIDVNLEVLQVRASYENGTSLHNLNS